MTKRLNFLIGEIGVYTSGRKGPEPAAAETAATRPLLPSHCPVRMTDVACVEAAAALISAPAFNFTPGMCTDEAGTADTALSLLAIVTLSLLAIVTLSLLAIVTATVSVEPSGTETRTGA